MYHKKNQTIAYFMIATNKAVPSFLQEFGLPMGCYYIVCSSEKAVKYWPSFFNSFREAYYNSVS